MIKNATERKIVKKWLDLRQKASWWGGYPAGSSYIDSRVQVAKVIKDFVNFDHLFVELMPRLKGKDDVFIETLLKKER